MTYLCWKQGALNGVLQHMINLLLNRQRYEMIRKSINHLDRHVPFDNITTLPPALPSPPPLRPTVNLPS